MHAHANTDTHTHTYIPTTGLLCPFSPWVLNLRCLPRCLEAGNSQITRKSIGACAPCSETHGRCGKPAGACMCVCALIFYLRALRPSFAIGTKNKKRESNGRERPAGRPVSPCWNAGDRGAREPNRESMYIYASERKCSRYVCACVLCRGERGKMRVKRDERESAGQRLTRSTFYSLIDGLGGEVERTRIKPFIDTFISL